MTRQHPVDTLRTSSRELELIMNELDRVGGEEITDLRRALKRWKFNGSKALVTLLSETGRRQNYVVAPRNLSAGGTGVLHGGFVHAGTRCIVAMRRRNGSVACIPGSVIRCSHIRGRLHELGIEFDHTTDPEQFLEFENRTNFNTERVDVSTLRGTLLVIDDSLADQRLVAHYFKDSNLDVLFAKDAKSGLAMLADGPDVVFVDYQLPDLDGVTLIEKAKDSGFAGPMLVVSADHSPGLRDRAQAAGAAEVIAKPCPKELLHQAAAEYLMVDSDRRSTGHGPILASADSAGVSLELLEMFINDLKNYSRQIEDCLNSASLPQLRSIATQIKGSSKGYGLESVGAAAEDLMRSLDATMSVEESANAARRLGEFCRRAKAVP